MIFRRVKHEIENGWIRPIAEQEEMPSRSTGFLDDSYFRSFPGDYRKHVELYDPMWFYENWQDASRKEDLPVPHIEFSNIDENNENEMVEFCSRWGSLSYEENINVDGFKILLNSFKKMIRIKAAIDKGEYIDEDIVLFDMQINNVLEKVNIKTNHVRHGDVMKLHIKYEIPSLIIALFYMIHKDTLARLNTKYCSDEDGNGCGRIFTSKRKETKYCSDTCKERAKCARYYKRKTKEVQQ